MEKTYVHVQGQWQSLSRAIDRDGHLVAVRLSALRDLAAAEACFRSAWPMTGVIPDRSTTDGPDAYPRAIRQVFGNQVAHRTQRYLNNHVESDHRGSTQRERPMGGFKHGHTAARLCRACDEVRAFLRPQSQRNQRLSLAQRRHLHRERFAQ